MRKILFIVLMLTIVSLAFCIQAQSPPPNSGTEIAMSAAVAVERSPMSCSAIAFQLTQTSTSTGDAAYCASPPANNMVNGKSVIANKSESVVATVLKPLSVTNSSIAASKNSMVAPLGANEEITYEVVTVVMNDHQLNSGSSFHFLS